MMWKQIEFVASCPELLWWVLDVRGNMSSNSVWNTKSPTIVRKS